MPGPVRIVLVRPRNPNNIGAAARAMANFGLEDLVVVDPYEPVWRETVSAVGAEEVMRAARRLSLFEALADCHLVLGATTGWRRRLDDPRVSLPELPAFRESRLGGLGRTAVLFGSEKNGLGNDELFRCHGWLNIPTCPGAPSMNLGQAVAVVCYELARGRAPGGQAVKAYVKKRSTLPAARQLEDLAEKMRLASRGLGFKRENQREDLLGRLERSLPRWGLTRRDAARLQLLFGKINARLERLR